MRGHWPDVPLTAWLASLSLLLLLLLLSCSRSPLFCLTALSPLPHSFYPSFLISLSLLPLSPFLLHPLFSSFLSLPAPLSFSISSYISFSLSLLSPLSRRPSGLHARPFTASPARPPPPSSPQSTFITAISHLQLAWSSSKHCSGVAHALQERKNRRPYNTVMLGGHLHTHTHKHGKKDDCLYVT